MRVNEIFYSLQGEGYHTGTPATFVRFSGCNLKCPFCDTDFKLSEEMSDEDIVDAVKDNPSDFVVITGGEPALQLTSSLVDKLHDAGKYVAVETNGTIKLPLNVDWITVSPKKPYLGNVAELAYNRADEVKVVFDSIHDVDDYGIIASHYYLQPCDTGREEENKEIISKCVEFIKKNPKWKLSLQTQKILNVR